MKKFLVILTLALALCLVCGIALAEDPDYQVGPDGRQHTYDLDSEPLATVYPTIKNGQPTNGYIRFKCTEHDEVDDFKDYPIYPMDCVYYTWNEVKDHLDNEDMVKSYVEPTCTSDGSVEVYVNLDESTGLRRIRGTKTWKGMAADAYPKATYYKALTGIAALKGDHLPSNVYYADFDFDAPQYTDVVEATCAQKGSLTVFCLRCKEHLGKPITIMENPNAHPEDAIVTTDIPATCSSAGIFSVFCTACETYIVAPDVVERPIPEDTTAEDVIHSDPGFATKVYDPTDGENQEMDCATQQDGVAVFFKMCSACNYRVRIVEVTPWTHTWSDWTFVAVPTCSEPGVIKRVCDKCEEEQIYGGEDANYNPEDDDEKEELDAMIAVAPDAHPAYRVEFVGYINSDDLDNPWDDDEIENKKGDLVTDTEIWDEGKSCSLRDLDDEFKETKENQDYLFIYRCGECDKIARVELRTADEHEGEEKIVQAGTCDESITKDDAELAFTKTQLVCKHCEKPLAEPVKGAKKQHTVPLDSWTCTVTGKDGAPNNYMGVCSVCHGVWNLVAYLDPSDPENYPNNGDSAPWFPEAEEDPEAFDGEHPFVVDDEADKAEVAEDGEVTGRIRLANGATEDDIPPRSVVRLAFYWSDGTVTVSWALLEPTEDGDFEYETSIDPGQVANLEYLAVNVQNKAVNPLRDDVLNYTAEGGVFAYGDEEQ